MMKSQANAIGEPRVKQICINVRLPCTSAYSLSCVAPWMRPGALLVLWRPLDAARCTISPVAPIDAARSTISPVAPPGCGQEHYQSCDALWMRPGALSVLWRPLDAARSTISPVAPPGCSQEQSATEIPDAVSRQ